MKYIKFRIDHTKFKFFQEDLPNENFGFLIAIHPSMDSYAAMPKENVDAFIKIFGAFMPEREFYVAEGFLRENQLIRRTQEYLRFDEKTLFPE